MAVSDVINITEQVSTSAPSRAAFGVPLILTEHSVTSNRVDTYKSLSAMVTAGYETTSTGYIWAAIMFAQSPRPPKVKIGRIDSGDGNVNDSLNAVYAADQEWYLLLHPDSYSATEATERTNILGTALWAESERVLYMAETGAASLLSAGDTVASALKANNYARTACSYHAVSAQTSTLTIDAAFVTSNSFVCIVNGSAITPEVFATTSDAMLAAIAAALQSEDSIATAVVTTVGGTTEDDREIVITAASPWEDVLITGAFTTLGATQNTAAFAVTSAASRPLSAAWAGRVLPKDPGAVNFANQANLAGVTADDISGTAVTAIEAQNANYYTQLTTDWALTRLGTMASGLYMDSRRDLDALKTDLEDAVIAMFANADKVPQDAAGLALVENTLVGVLVRYRAAGFLTGDVESAVDMGAATITARVLSGVVINVEGAGALNAMNITLNFQEN